MIAQEGSLVVTDVLPVVRLNIRAGDGTVVETGRTEVPLGLCVCMC